MSAIAQAPNQPIAGYCRLCGAPVLYIVTKGAPTRQGAGRSDRWDDGADIVEAEATIYDSKHGYVPRTDGSGMYRWLTLRGMARHRPHRCSGRESVAQPRTGSKPKSATSHSRADARFMVFWREHRSRHRSCFPTIEAAIAWAEARPHYGPDCVMDRVDNMIVHTFDGRRAA